MPNVDDINQRMVTTLLGDGYAAIALKIEGKYRLCGRSKETGAIYPLAFVRDNAPEGLDVVEIEELADVAE